MKKPTLWERYITKEIGIEFKACLYFFAFIFFYCIYRLCMGLHTAEILHMAEMILLTYIMGYIQVYLLWNFDEAESLGAKEWLGIIVCTSLYSLSSYICNWFDKNIYLTIGLGFYIIFVYICVFLIYKWRRKIDDKILNSDLEIFKARNKHEK